MSHDGQPVNMFHMYAMSHKGKATFDVRYNLEDGPSASAYSRLSTYSEVAKEVHGPKYDPAAHDLEGEVVMRAGEVRSMGGTSLATV